MPVEWWIMSFTNTDNEIPKENEGLTEIKLIDDSIFLKKAIKLAEKELLALIKTNGH